MLAPVSIMVSRMKEGYRVLTQKNSPLESIQGAAITVQDRSRILFLNTLTCPNQWKFA